jgi:phosphoserine phosphatase RsbU/P
VSLFERFSRTVALITALVFAVLATNRLAAQAPVHAAAQVSIVDASDLLQPTSFDEGWLVEAGDNPAWAGPDYDDSQWHRFNARTDSLHALFPQQRPEVVWYRLHMTVAPHDAGLALEEWYLGSAFEIYSNGVRILQVGSVHPYSAYDYSAHLLAAIPRDQIASGKVVIAIRAHISATEWAGAYPGLYYQNLVFGQEGALRQHIWLSVIGNYALLDLDGLLILAVIVGVALLYSAQRRVEYLFLTLVLTAALMPAPLELYGAFHAFPAWWHLVDSLSMLFVFYLWARTYLAFIARPVGWRMQTFLVFGSVIFGMEMTLEWMNISTATTQIAGFVPFIVLFGVVLPAIFISAMRRGDRHAGILLVPMLLTVSVQSVRLILIGLEQIPALRGTASTLSIWLNTRTAGPFTIPPDVVAGILSVLSLALIVLLRSNRQSRQQAVLESEIASARQVQQVILPDAVESVPGFRVESVYEPAQEVGGDFFQTISDGAGGMIVIVGDVSGKGLPAAMLVSMLVGAIRSVTESTCAPDAILAHLNRRLIGRAKGGFSTAIAAHISASGAVTIANAGHLAPYLDGRELELPGALPLGVDAKAAYETHTFTLAPENRLVFYSDGVVEAQNTKGELLGFARAAELSTKQVTDIAAEAKSFGQSDDITVIAIAWEGARPARQEPVAIGSIREYSLNPTPIR